MVGTVSVFWYCVLVQQGVCGVALYQWSSAKWCHRALFLVHIKRKWYQGSGASSFYVFICLWQLMIKVHIVLSPYPSSCHLPRVCKSSTGWQWDGDAGHAHCLLSGQWLLCRILVSYPDPGLEFGYETSITLVLPLRCCMSLVSAWIQLSWRNTEEILYVCHSHHGSM